VITTAIIIYAIPIKGTIKVVALIILFPPPNKQKPTNTANIKPIIHQEYNLNSTYCNEMIHALLSKFFIILLRHLHVAETFINPKQTPEDTQRIELIDNFFTENFAQKGREETLASKLHLSKRQLARVLQEYYGMGYHQKLISARMDHATWLLRTTTKQIGEIAELVGYTSEAAFYQIFKKQFGITPRQNRSRY